MQRLSSDIRVDWTNKIAEIDVPGFGTLIYAISNPSPPQNLESFCDELRRDAQRDLSRGMHQTRPTEQDSQSPETETTQESHLPGNRPDLEPTRRNLSTRQLEKMLKDFKSKMPKE